MNRACWSHSVLFIVLIGWSAVSSAQTHYRLTRIGPQTSPLLGVATVDLNDKGEVLVSQSDGSSYRVYFWKYGEITDLSFDVPLQAGIYTASLNNHSEIAGAALFDGAYQGFLWRRGHVTLLSPTPNGFYFFAEDINDRSQIVGESEQTYLLDRRGYTALEDSAFTSGPSRINKHGAVVGNVWDESLRTVLWQNGVRTKLEWLPGGTQSFATDINDRGQIAGTVSSIEIIGEFLVIHWEQAALWHEGQVQALPWVKPDEDDQALALNLNNNGLVVGYERKGRADDYFAVIWCNGAALDLNSLIATDDPLRPYVTLTQASLVNERDEIVAYGRDSRNPTASQPYMLTPVRESGDQRCRN
jgi:uncharacterized membrane protein